MNQATRNSDLYICKGQTIIEKETTCGSVDTGVVVHESIRKRGNIAWTIDGNYPFSITTK